MKKNTKGCKLLKHIKVTDSCDKVTIFVESVKDVEFVFEKFPRACQATHPESVLTASQDLYAHTMPAQLPLALQCH